MDVRLIVNPVAGGGRGRDMGAAVAAALERRGAVLEVVTTQVAGDATAAAGRAGAECIVAVGGDGTINEVVNGLSSREPLIAVVPVGTANVVARELGVQPDPDQIAEAVMRRQSRPFDLGRAGERHFLLGAGGGLDAAIVDVVHRQRGHKSSYWRWVVPAIKTILSYEYPRIRVTVDGRVVSESAQYAIVGNCRYSAGLFPATRRAKPDDGLLDVCLVGDLHPLRLLDLAISVWREGFPDRKDVVYERGQHVVFEPVDGAPVPLQIDGDPGGRLPATFDIEPAALSVIAPALA